MKDSFFVARLVAPNALRILVIAPVPKEDKSDFLLLTDGKYTETLKIERVSPQQGGFAYDVKLRDPLALGHDYEVLLDAFGAAAVDVSAAIDFAGFDDEFGYDGDDLGATYSPDGTMFCLWAPLASRVMLRLVSGGQVTLFPMVREAHGIYRLNVPGNHEGATYRYQVTNSGLTRETTDPYAKGSTQNGEDSVVVNFAAVAYDLAEKSLPPLGGYTDAIIYETSVRDITSDQTTSIVHKGRFLGMIESGVKTAKGYPAGFDYLTRLGITHLQLLPIYDFKTIDERNPAHSYNWGYDPAQYFVPEGSFASVLEDPLSRIRDLKALVAAYHKAGIRITMDVVFNHVYQYQFSVFEKVVPGYFFRRKKNGKMSDGSFCGNDVASERRMVRKMIVDACVYWVKEYGIDGYRFDLMGILDIDTMKAILLAVRALKPDAMLYGEGWNMPTELPDEQKATLYRADKLPDFAFFNDAFRDIVKGGTLGDKIAEPGYVLGAANYRLGFKFAYVGSCLDLVFPARFKSARQSINYVECHDNETFFDKLDKVGESDDLDIRLKRVKLAAAAVMFSFGVPFFHMGQEIGLSKGGDVNSYRAGDKVNKFDYRTLDERVTLALYFADLVKFRKKYPFFRLERPTDIEKMIRFEDLGESGLRIDYGTPSLIAPWKAVVILINPSSQTIYHELDDYYQVLFAESGMTSAKEIFVKNVMLNGITLMVLGRR